MVKRQQKVTYLREERDRAFFEAYNRAVSTGTFQSQKDAIDYARTHEAPRFYIDPEFLYIIIGRIRRGVDTGLSGYHSKAKFAELYRRFQEEASNPKNSGLSTMDICCIVVNQPAPSFYIGWRSARSILSSQKEIRWRELQERMQR